VLPCGPHPDRVHTYIFILRMEGKAFRLGRPIITVVQPAQSIMGKHASRGYAASSAPRRFLAQSKGRAVLVMVGNVLGKEPLQVPLVERNDRVEQLAAAAPHPTLGDTILPGTCERGWHIIYFPGSNGCRDLASVFCIPVMDEKSGSRGKRKRLPQLLDDPTAGRMFGDLEMQDSRAIVADARGTASKHPRNDGRIPRRFGQPPSSAVWDACVSARPAVAGERDFPGATDIAAEESVQAVDFKAGQNFGEAQGSNSLRRQPTDKNCFSCRTAVSCGMFIRNAGL
jgi:hypothetical protein